MTRTHTLLHYINQIIDTVTASFVEDFPDDETSTREHWSQ